MIHSRIIRSEEDCFGFLPIFVPSGSSGLGLFDEKGYVVAIILSTTDSSDGLRVKEGTYSTEDLGRLFVKSNNLDRHEPIHTRVLGYSRILDILKEGSFVDAPADDFLCSKDFLSSGGNSGALKRHKVNASSPDKNREATQVKQAEVIRDGVVVETFLI
jgi:hypothetical protein